MAKVTKATEKAAATEVKALSMAELEALLMAAPIERKLAVGEHKITYTGLKIKDGAYANAMLFTCEDGAEFQLKATINQVLKFYVQSMVDQAGIVAANQLEALTKMVGHTFTLYVTPDSYQDDKGVTQPSTNYSFKKKAIVVANDAATRASDF